MTTKRSNLSSGPGIVIPGASMGSVRGGWIAAGCAYQSPAVPALTYSTGALDVDYLHLQPFRFSAPGVVTHICFRNTAGTPSVRAGIYQVGASSIALLAESASTALGGTGLQEIDIADQNVIPGVTYLAGIVHNGSLTVKTIATAVAPFADFPIPFDSTFGAPNSGWIDPHTYGALPATLSITINAGSWFSPLIALKMSS